MCNVESTLGREIIGRAEAFPVNIISLAEVIESVNVELGNFDAEGECRSKLE